MNHVMNVERDKPYQLNTKHVNLLYKHFDIFIPEKSMILKGCYFVIKWFKHKSMKPCSD